jgi:hypothetical protein
VVANRGAAGVRGLGEGVATVPAGRRLLDGAANPTAAARP